MTPAAYSTETFGAAYGVGRSKVYEEIKAGRLIARKVGATTLILAQDADAWAQALPRMERGK